VLRLDPANAMTMNNLAIILASGDDPAIRDPAGAIELAERAATLTGRSNPDILTTLARAHSAAGDNDKARAILDEVTALRQRQRSSQ
jgi:Flp pilus assembly protein TadD